jgi:uroporphyrinogen-III synthase
MPDLRGARIGLLEGRMSQEIADLVRRNGGVPVSAPALREDPIPSGERVSRFIDELTAGRLSFVILLTGVGAMALAREAEAMDRLSELIAGLEHTTTICRGPKPAGALAKHGVSVDVRVPSPHTTRDVIETMATLPIEGSRVGLVHYGERNEPLTAAIEERGAIVDELCLYEWHLPHDVEPLRALVRDAIEGRLDAVAFTSQVQVRHLLQIAESMHARDALLTALAQRTIAIAAIGPTCADALRDVGIEPDVVPDPPKLGPLFAALADHLARTGSAQS